MRDLFDISKFDSYKEDNRREVKKANGGLPVSLWDTYSAFANCYGGVIILGAAENKDGTWRTTGLDVADKGKFIKQFWDIANNRKKVSINILKDDDVETYDVNGDLIIVIYVPMAKRDQKPVYINDDLFGSTFRRNHEGDYREMLDPAIRWTDRIQSSSGEWSGNLCDFYFRVYNKISMDIKTPFVMQGGDRIEDTPVHKALREALANCLINADYYGTRGLVIRKEPLIEERFDPDRTILILEFVKKQAKKASEENKRRKQAKKTSEESKRKKTSVNITKIYEYLAQCGEAKTNDIADYIGLSASRTRAILAKLDHVEAIGATTNRKYKLKK